MKKEIITRVKLTAEGKNESDFHEIPIKEYEKMLEVEAE